LLAVVAGDPGVAKLTVAMSVRRLTVALRRGEADGRKSSCVSGEAVMYSTINYQIMQARVADMHRQARQDALARAARKSRQPHLSGRRVLRLPVIAARRLLAA
jgi:hypothetical protein